MQFTAVIERWFNDQGGGSLVLPDGWFGRPYDSQHSLTSVDESEQTFSMILSQNLTLRFAGLKSVEIRDGALVLGPFDRLQFDWVGFGDSKRRGAREYQAGEVKIVPAPGKRAAL